MAIVKPRCDNVRRGHEPPIDCAVRRFRTPGESVPMTKNMLDGGQVIVDYLIREKVPYVFGLCGHGNIGFLDALYERSDEIKTVSVHHESVAGFMADVYYPVGGKPTATF